MKKKFISIILTFLLIQPAFCLAEESSSNLDISSSGSSLLPEFGDSVNLPINIVSEDGTTENYIADVKLLLNQAVDLKKGEKQEVLRECIFKDTSEGKNKYNLSKALVSITCKATDIFKAYINCTNETDTLHSNNGEIIFYVPSEEVFSVDLKSKQSDLNCDLGVLGIGVNSSTEKIFPMDLKCNSLESVSAANIISPIAKGFTSIVLLLLSLF